MIAAQIEHHFPGRRFDRMTPQQVAAYHARIADLIGSGEDGADRQMRLMERKRRGRRG